MLWEKYEQSTSGRSEREEIPMWGSGKAFLEEVVFELGLKLELH